MDTSILTPCQNASGDLSPSCAACNMLSDTSTATATAGNMTVSISALTSGLVFDVRPTFMLASHAVSTPHFSDLTQGRTAGALYLQHCWKHGVQHSAGWLMNCYLLAASEGP